MNGRKAKTARRLARDLSVGLPERQLLVKSLRAKNKKQPSDIFGFSGKEQIINDPRSFRGQYLAMKKLLKQGAAMGLGI